MFFTVVKNEASSEAIVTSKDEATDVQLDISKYEGHTPGPWVWAKYPETENLKWCLTRERETSTGIYIPETFCYLVKFQQPLEKWNIHAQNYKLIADAPLLLEEVKRLRKELEWFKQAINITADHIPRRAHWDAYVAEMVEKGLWPDEPED